MVDGPRGGKMKASNKAETVAGRDPRSRPGLNYGSDGLIKIKLKLSPNKNYLGIMFMKTL